MYGSHKKHSAGARNVKARAKRALLLPSTIRMDELNIHKYALRCLIQSRESKFSMFQLQGNESNRLRMEGYKAFRPLGLLQSF